MVTEIEIASRLTRDLLSNPLLSKVAPKTLSTWQLKNPINDPNNRILGEKVVISTK